LLRNTHVRSPSHSPGNLRAARRPATAISNPDSESAAARAAQESGLWAKLQGTKRVVSEPRGTGEAFTAAMAQFYAAVASGRGALFFAICRGKVPSRGALVLAQLPAILMPVCFHHACLLSRNLQPADVIGIHSFGPGCFTI